MFRRLFPSLLFAFVHLCAANAAHADSSSVVEMIDRLLIQSWDRDGITPAPISGDAEFCRRVWLDLAGVAPPVMAVRVFLSDPLADKRERLIDRLLRSPQYANHMATRWTEILLPPDAETMQPQSALALHGWLRTQFRANKPYDHLVGGFLTAGGAGDTGPAIFYTSHSLEPQKLAAATSRIFMGIQLQCAQCHDHPFDRWTQEDFWKYAAFFAQLRQSDPRAGRDAIIEDRPGGEVRLPDTERVMLPRYPGAALPPEKDPTDHRRRQLTIWLASRDNPYFARAAVNRVWSHLFGRGLVDPVDAMDADNKPSHPELLDFLAAHFTEQRFDLRELYATLARTTAYQRTSSVTAELRPPSASFAAMTPKTLTAAQYYDSLQQNVYRRSIVASADDRSADQAARQQFLSRMRSPGSSPHDFPHGVVQALAMMNGPEVSQAMSSDRSGLIGSLEVPFFDDSDRIEAVFLAVLSRRPNDDERGRFAAHVAAAHSSQQKSAAISDLLWILLNTAECYVCP